MTEDTLADLLILHESYKNQSIPSTCITDVKKRPWAFGNKKKAEIGEVDKAKVSELLPQIHHRRTKEKNESDDEVELFCFRLVSTLRRLSPCEKDIPKIQVQQLLFNLEFPQVMPVQEAAYPQINTDGNGAACMHENPYF